VHVLKQISACFEADMHLSDARAAGMEGGPDGVPVDRRHHGAAQAGAILSGPRPASVWVRACVRACVFVCVGAIVCLCVCDSCVIELKKSNVLDPLGPQARERRSASESAGTRPEWSSAWSNRPWRSQEVPSYLSSGRYNDQGWQGRTGA
jgi:hypothetical protein